MRLRLRNQVRGAVGLLGARIFSPLPRASILGIPGLLRTLSLQDRAAPLRIHGPAPAQRALSPLITLGMERPKFPVEVHELSPGDRLDRGEYELVVGEAFHKGPALCFALVEHDRLGRFDPDRARALGIPEVRWGQIIEGSWCCRWSDC